MKIPFILSLFLLLVTLSCNKSNVRIITYDLKRSDFVEQINVTGTIQAVNSFPVVAPRNDYGGIMSVIHLVADGSYVKKGDTLCVLSSPDLLTVYDNISADFALREVGLRKLEADNALNMSILLAQLETTNANMQISSLDSIQMKFAPPVKQKLLALEMEKVAIEKRKLEKKLASRKIIDETEIRQMKSVTMQQQLQLQRFKDQISSLTIIADKDGFIMHTEAPTLMIMSSNGAGTLGGKIEEGSSVFSSMALLQFPDLSKMQVSAEVSEGDYRNIEQGQKVSIKADAISNLITTGQINRKMPAGQNRRSDSQVKTYEVIIDIDSCHSELKPGLSASCEIIVKEVKDTIVVPSLAIFERDSLKIVYVLEKNKFLPVAIETGSSNSSHTIVTKGLKGNETIALSEPSHNLIKHAIKPAAEKNPAEKPKTEMAASDTIRKSIQ